MICPNCKVNLEGELIYETFFKKYNDASKALEFASQYGATETEGCWGRQLGIYDWDEDRVVAWQCPDCGHVWER